MSQILFDKPQPVEFELFSTPLDDAQPYEAISYTWGRSTETAEVVINEKRFRTTASAVAVLQQRGSYKHPRTIWIDSICINQNDEEEKASQVCMMKEIYQKASRVVVWLGGSITASTAITSLYFLQMGMLHDERDKLHDTLLRSLPIITGSFDWPAFRELVSHPWFSRVWVVQEVAVASNIHVVYGGYYIGWSMLAWVMKSLHENELRTILAPDLISPPGQSDIIFAKESFANVAMVSGLRRRLQSKENNELPLNNLLAGCSFRKSTDDRDRVFALLGLTSDALEDFVQPDYKKSVQEVYFDTARYIVAQTHASWILPLAGMGFQCNTPGLPSWVPDWSTPRQSNTLTYVPITANEDDAYNGYKYTASGNTKLSLTYNAASRSVAVKGAVVDKIKIIGPRCGMESRDQPLTVDSFVEFQEWFRETLEMAVKEVCNPYPFGRIQQSLHEAYWRTLIGDRIYEARPVPKEYGEYYELAKAGMEEVVKTDQMRHIWPFMPRLFQGDTSAMDEISKLSERVDFFSLDSFNMQALLEGHIKRVKFLHEIRHCAYGRKFCISEKGYMGFVAPLCQPGDLVCIIMGTQVPFILRPAISAVQEPDSDETFTLMGESYFHGMMDGEIVDGSANGRHFIII